MIRGATKERIDFYYTGPEPTAAKEMGFWGAKVPLPYCAEVGHVGLKKNVEFLRRHRESIGPGFPLMVDCYMSLNVSCMIDLAKACSDLNINWWEECLSPDDTDGLRRSNEPIHSSNSLRESTSTRDMDFGNSLKAAISISFSRMSCGLVE